MNEISIFDFGQSSIRSLLIDGKPYFVGRDIAAALGYKEPQKAIARHCRGGMRHPITDNLGREQETTIIPESDLYQLSFSSKLSAVQRNNFQLPVECKSELKSIVVVSHSFSATATKVYSTFYFKEEQDAKD